MEEQPPCMRRKALKGGLGGEGGSGSQSTLMLHGGGLDVMECDGVRCWRGGRSERESVENVENVAL